MGARRAAAPAVAGACGKTLGILGYGRIGRCVADAPRLRHGGHAIRRAVAGSAGTASAFLGGPEHLGAVLRRADYLVIALSLTPTTRGLIDARAIAPMKPTAVLVNVARAEIVDAEALYRALASRASPAARWTSGIATRRRRPDGASRPSPSTSCRTC